MLTQLIGTATPGRRYGSFAGKALAASPPDLRPPYSATLTSATQSATVVSVDQDVTVTSVSQEATLI